MELLIYVGKVSLYWTLFYTCYQLILRQQTFFTWNRFYLLASLTVSLALPFVIYPEAAPKISAIYEVSNASFTMTAADQNQSHLFNWGSILGSVYATGVLFMIFRLYQNLRQLSEYIKQGERIELDDCTLVLINADQVGSFSFLKWIVVNRNDYENHFDAILRHEMVHMEQRHTLDILLIESLKIIFWFNPILILYKNLMQEIHEFLADAEAPNRENYATFLVSYALNAPITSLTNHFFKPSQIKTRIQMIYKNRTSKWMLSSYVFAFISIGMVSLFVAGCEQKESNDLTETMEKVSGSSQDGRQNPGEKKIYSEVEEQPEFPGGTEAMFKFLGQNIRYPKAAVDAHVEGRIFLSFLVTETGEVQDIKVTRGMGFGMDEEAIRVLSLFPKWKPAKQDGVPVNVRFNLPINFQLEESKDKKKQTSQNDRPSENKVGINAPNALYVINGKIEKDPEVMKNMDPDHILSVNVLKGEKALDAYGEDGRYGVISIMTKQ